MHSWTLSSSQFDKDKLVYSTTMSSVHNIAVWALVMGTCITNYWKQATFRSILLYLSTEVFYNLLTAKQ